MWQLQREDGKWFTTNLSGDVEWTDNQELAACWTTKDFDLRMVQERLGKMGFRTSAVEWTYEEPKPPVVRRSLREAVIGDRLQFAPPANQVGTVTGFVRDGFMLTYCPGGEPEWLSLPELEEWGIYILEFVDGEWR